MDIFWNHTFPTEFKYLKKPWKMLGNTEQKLSEWTKTDQGYFLFSLGDNSVQFQKKSISTLWRVIRNSLGEGGLKSQNFRSKV